ncbi:MAG: aromatic ring-hydroxylating dioxygenase subunit alpha [Xanthomonadales bacterium]|nr:aromatic ring-hydroxylating dioxygenase subunit alpha [Xanthomonadales bacterium]
MSTLPVLDWRTPQTLAQAHGLPAACYTDAELALRERSAVFARSWQFVAHAAQLSQPGDHVVTEVAGTPLLLLRDDNGVLRALHNVCRHRGGPLATANGCGLKQLRCQYHGWTYDLQGGLRSGPELDAIEGLDRTQTRLPQARADIWQGLVFVALDPGTPPLSELVAGIDGRLAEPLDDYVFQRRISYPATCNWKAYVDNYLEGYHVPHIHPELNRLLDYRSYRTECEAWHSLQWSPLDNNTSFYGSGTALYYFLWPNTMLNILPGRLQTNRIVPTGVDSCRIDFEYYYRPGLVEAHADRITQDQDLAEITQQQDVDICERVQRAFASGSYTVGRVHPTREQGVHHFQELYRAALRSVGNG